MQTEFVIGDIVKSLLGHDKNNIFIVVSIDKNGYIAIIDGKYRKKENPKSKNPKHLVKIGHDDNLLNKVSQVTVTNKEIYNYLKQFKVKE